MSAACPPPPSPVFTLCRARADGVTVEIAPDGSKSVLIKKDGQVIRKQIPATGGATPASAAASPADEPDEAPDEAPAVTPSDSSVGAGIPDGSRCST